MGTKYSALSISGYNSSPPSDDGTVAASNQIKWSFVKDKVGDPLKTLAEAINTALVTYVNLGPNSQAAAYPVVAGDHLKTIEATGTTTITLADAATLGAGYTVTIANAGTATVTIARATGADTFNGSTTNFILPQKTAVTVQVNASANGFLVIANKGATNNALGFIGMINGTIVASRAGSAETVAIKTLAGADPSAGDPVTFVFRNVTAATGDYVSLEATAALSLTISSGSTLGMTNGIIARLRLVVFNDGGTLRLGIVNTLSGTNIMALKDDDLRSSTAEGGAGAADSAQVIYTGTAVSSKAMRLLGYLEYTLATAGTWGTAPSAIQLAGPGVPLPRTVVQESESISTAVSTGTTATANDNTIPQNTEGNQYLSQSITPTSAANLLRIRAGLNLAHSVTIIVQIALYQDSTANALRAINGFLRMTGEVSAMPVLEHAMLAATTSSTTFNIRAGASSGATTTFNGQAGAAWLGGVMPSYLRVEEIMT